MSKVEIRTLESVTANDATATTLINSNFEALQQAIENTVSRDGTVPNYMDSNLDLNSYKLINVGNPENDHDVITKKYFEDSIGDAASYATQAVTAANAAASSAQSAAVSASEAISTLAQAGAVIQQAASDAAKAAEDSIENYIENTVKPEIQLSVDAAEASLNSYVDGTVKPSLQTYVDQAQEDANSAATSMEQAALSATSASNYASNASAEADNSAESAGLAANSAAAAAESEGKAAEYLQQVSDKITTVEGSIGDIGFSPLGIDETQNKRRYLNGQVISQTQFSTFTDKVKAAVALYPSLATTETNWQAEVTNSKLGQCGKFVIDDTAGTIRLPKVVNINGLQDLALMGSIKAESLPKPTLILRTDSSSSTDTDLDAIYGNDGYTATAQSNTSGTDEYMHRTYTTGNSAYMDIFHSSYQDNAPVQQEAVQYPYFIQVATGSEESVDVSTEIQLNNPFFFGMHIWSDTAISNASWLISNGSYHSGATYASFYQWLLKIHNGTLTVDGVSVKAYGASGITDYDYVINTTDTTFRLPIKVKLSSGNAVVGNGVALGLTDGTNNMGLIGYSANTQGTGIGMAAATPRYGTEVGSTGQNLPLGVLNASAGITTDPTKSGIETSSDGLKLYFYVGETIQDANVIAASKVLTTLADCVRKSEADYVVESYKSGENWYRIYKSGWIEQGGRAKGDATINYLKPFSDTNYCLAFGTEITTYSYTSGGKDRTTTGFKTLAWSWPATWYACGQGA